MGSAWPPQLDDALLAAGVVAGGSIEVTAGSSTITLSNCTWASFAAFAAGTSNLPT